MGIVPSPIYQSSTPKGLVAPACDPSSPVVARDPHRALVAPCPCKRSSRTWSVCVIEQSTSATPIIEVRALACSSIVLRTLFEEEACHCHRTTSQSHEVTTTGVRWAEERGTGRIAEVCPTRGSWAHAVTRSRFSRDGSRPGGNHAHVRRLRLLPARWTQSANRRRSAARRPVIIGSRAAGPVIGFQRGGATTVEGTLQRQTG